MSADVGQERELRLEAILARCNAAVRDPGLPPLDSSPDAMSGVFGFFPVYFPEEIVHALPRIAHDEAPVEVVILARIDHEAREIGLPGLEQMIHQQHGVNERHVDVGSSVQNQKRMLDLIDV